MKFYDEDGKQLSARDYCDRYYVAKKQAIPPRYQEEIDKDARAEAKALAEAEAKAKADSVQAEAAAEGEV